MEKAVFYAAGYAASHTYACKALARQGVIFTEKPEMADFLLLPVPSLDDGGYIRGGGSAAVLAEKLEPSAAVIGGKLEGNIFPGRRCIDLLDDPFFAAENAHITACCAVRLAMERLPVILTGLPVLVIGWGRIGKCLSLLLKALGTQVTVAARKETDRAMAASLGFDTLDISQAQPEGYRLIFNTVPCMVLPQCPGNGLKLDLASRRGLGGLDTAWERGLPGRLAPESTGELIARRVLAILEKESGL